MSQKQSSLSNLTIGIELINDPTWMGGTIYLGNLVRCLSRLPEAERPRLELLGDFDSIQRFQSFLPSAANSKRSPRILRLFPWRNISRIIRLFDCLQLPQKRSINVYYPGFGSTPPGAVLMRWIPDFQHRYLPELFSNEECRVRDISMSNVASQPGIVILSSECALNDFCHFYPQAKSTPRVWSFHSLLDLPALTDFSDFRLPPELPAKFLYLPNQFWVHKNHLVLFKALLQLREGFGMNIPVVCTGSSTDSRAVNYYQDLLGYLNEHQLTHQVFLLGLLPRDQQLHVFRHCAAVVQPSLFEGWSTVVEDARAIGRPIFLSDLPVHREQLPENQLFFDPHSPADLARLIAQHWPQLTAGPDVKAEASAHAYCEELILSSARRFVTYCLEANQLAAARGA